MWRGDPYADGGELADIGHNPFPLSVIVTPCHTTRTPLFGLTWQLPTFDRQWTQVAAYKRAPPLPTDGDGP